MTHRYETIGWDVQNMWCSRMQHHMYVQIFSAGFAQYNFRKTIQSFVLKWTECLCFVCSLYLDAETQTKQYSAAGKRVNTEKKSLLARARVWWEDSLCSCTCFTDPVSNWRSALFSTWITQQYCLPPLQFVQFKTACFTLNLAHRSAFDKAACGPRAQSLWVKSTLTELIHDTEHRLI